MNLTRKRLDAIRIALNIVLLKCDGDGRIDADDTSVTFAEAREAAAWVAERIEKLDKGTWY